MSLIELEQEVQKLSPSEFCAFTKWLEAYAASQWDAQLEEDVASGKLARILDHADAEFLAGRCREL